MLHSLILHAPSTFWIFASSGSAGCLRKTPALTRSWPSLTLLHTATAFYALHVDRVVPPVCIHQGFSQRRRYSSYYTVATFVSLVASTQFIRDHGNGTGLSVLNFDLASKMYLLHRFLPIEMVRTYVVIHDRRRPQPACYFQDCVLKN